MAYTDEYTAIRNNAGNLDSQEFDDLVFNLVGRFVRNRIEYGEAVVKSDCGELRKVLDYNETICCERARERAGA